MTYTVHIRKNDTGEIRVYREDLEWDDSSEFWWTEGNMGCDCNRHLCFERAAGNKPDFDERPCGETAYTALFAELPDGTRIALDDSVDQPTDDV